MFGGTNSIVIQHPDFLPTMPISMRHLINKEVNKELLHNLELELLVIFHQLLALVQAELEVPETTLLLVDQTFHHHLVKDKEHLQPIMVHHQLHHLEMEVSHP